MHLRIYASCPAAHFRYPLRLCTFPSGSLHVSLCFSRLLSAAFGVQLPHFPLVLATPTCLERRRVWACAQCSTVLATVIAKPGFGDIAPAAIGAAVAVMVAASGAFTGGFYNTARFFGPSIIFGCGLNLIWLYFLAHLVGAWLAAAVHRYALFPSERVSAMLRPSLSAPLVNKDQSFQALHV